MDTLKEKAGLSTSMDKATFSKWVHEKAGRTLPLTDVGKLLGVVQRLEQKAWEDQRNLSSTLDMIPEWILTGRLSHAPLLGDHDEGFRFYWHMEGLSFALKLAEMLSENPASVPLKSPTRLMQLGIPDKSCGIRALLRDVHPRGENNDAVANGYESIAQRIGESVKGHPPLILVLGYTTAACEGLLESTSSDKSVNDHLRFLSHSWGVDCL